MIALIVMESTDFLQNWCIVLSIAVVLSWMLPFAIDLYRHHKNDLWGDD
jgi:hypothetical protein